MRNNIPDEILVLPGRTDTGNLEDENAVIVEKVVNLAHESAIAADTNVLEFMKVISIRNGCGKCT